MTRKRSSIRHENDESSFDKSFSQNEADFEDSAHEFSDGDDVEKFNKRVKSFDSKLSNSTRATQIDSFEINETGGTFQEIELFNFMCHEHLKVDLRDNINFVTGNNGSGKSAILTGLTVCLGARASTTQRATSLESLIKEGTSEARVIVKISNSGALKYKGELYGDSIIVERRFRRNGPNSFKTKSAINGRIISDRKDEVIAICDNYNIQVDNPLSILTQEMAKKFLVNSTPQNLYEFFMRATQLEQLSFDYAYALDRMKSIHSSLNNAKQSWPSLEEKIENMRIEIQTFEEQKVMAQKINELKAEIMWAEVTSKESDAKLKENHILEEQNHINSNNENASVLSKKMEETTTTIKVLDSEITELFKSKHPLTNELQNATASAEKLKANLKDSDNASRRINDDTKKFKEDLKEIEEKLTEESEKHNNADEIEKQKQREIESLEREIQEKNLEYKEIEAQISLKDAEAEDLESALDKASMLLSEEKLSVNDLTRELEKAKSASEDKINFFGDNLTQVLSIIEKRSREFKYKPIGPIGMYVELLDMEWSRTMDAIIGNHLKSFITRDHQDRILLESILHGCRCNNPIINLSPERIDVRDGEPDPKYLTALRVLRINDEFVKKALIIFCGIEKILLIADRAQAREAMNSNLRNVDSTYTKTHRVTSTQKSLAFFAIFPNSKGNPFESSKERIKEIQKQLETKKNSLKILIRDNQLIKEDIEKKRTEKEHLSDRKKSIKISIVNMRDEIKDIEKSLKSVDETGIDVLKAEHESITNMLESLKSQFVANIENRYTIAEELKDINTKLESINVSIENVDVQVEEKRILINRLSDEKRKIQTEIEFIQSSNRQFSNNISIYSAALKSIRDEIDDLTKKASAICERIITKRSITVIEKEIHSIEKLIEKGQEFNEEDYEYVKSEYEETCAEYEKSKINVRINENILDDMKIALEKRQRQWEDLRNGIAKRSNQDFSACLQARGYRGFLDYDHKKRELHINVHIDQIEKITSKSQELSKRDIKQLSGGEKSFGTTCFLLSLWDAMGCPIRCLDEFDVYMDAINRRLVVEMLINNARNSGTQFILITPVSVLNYLDGDNRENVHMVVLNDPQKIRPL